MSDEVKKETVKSDSSSKSMVYIVAGSIVVILIALLAVVFLRKQEEPAPELNSNEDIEAYMTFAMDKFVNFSGILEMNFDGGIIRYDTKNNVVEMSSEVVGVVGKENILMDGTTGAMFFNNDGQWLTYVDETAVESFNFKDDLGVALAAEDSTKYEFRGEEDCPEDIDGTCYELYDSENESTVYFSKSLSLPVFLKDQYSQFSMTYTKNESVELPDDAEDISENLERLNDFFGAGEEDLLEDLEDIQEENTDTDSSEE